MGEDFVSHRQQRSVEMVRMKNLREEKVLAMKLSSKGGLESSKRYELNRIRKEKQRLMRELDRMKALKARPKYSESIPPDVLKVQKEVAVAEAGNAVGTGGVDEVNGKLEKLEVDSAVPSDARVDSGKIIAYYGLSPRRPPDVANELYPDTINKQNEVKNGSEHQPLLLRSDTDLSSVKATPNRKGKKKKSKVQRMYEKSSAEFKQVQERMHTFIDALDDKQKWEVFCMFDSNLRDKRNVNASNGEVRGESTSGLSQSGRNGGRKHVPLNEINIEAIKDHIAERLFARGRTSPSSSVSPPHGPSPGAKGRMKPLIVIEALQDDDFRPSSSPARVELPILQEQKHERIKRWTNQQQTIPEQEEPDVDIPNVEHNVRARRRPAQPLKGTLGTIQEGAEKDTRDTQVVHNSEDRGDWNSKPPTVDGVFMDDFDGQVLYDPELFNADGSFRAVHMVPEFEASLAEAKKARYIRYGKDDVPEHEKDLSMNEIFGKSEEDDEIYQLMKQSEEEENNLSETEGDEVERDRSTSGDMSAGMSVVHEFESGSPSSESKTTDTNRFVTPPLVNS